MSTIKDPRVFFAAERTLLAWIRTGLTIMAFGFVVARFSLFVAFLNIQKSSSFDHSNFSYNTNLLGFLMILVGAFCIFISTFQHRNFIKQLEIHEMPGNYKPQVAIFLAFIIALLGVFVAGSLVVTFS